MLVAMGSTRFFPWKQFSVAMEREEKKTSKILYFVSEGPRKAAQCISQNIVHRVSDKTFLKNGSSDIVSTR